MMPKRVMIVEDYESTNVNLHFAHSPLIGQSVPQVRFSVIYPIPLVSYIIGFDPLI